MAYTELTKEKTPDTYKFDTNITKAVMDFIRNDCSKLKFTDNQEENFNRDVDRLSFENAIKRFMINGSRDEAFDIYVSYCEIFKPFGDGYNTVRYLVELLAEHETHSSSLLMKHRDHYTHSIYAFLIGITIFKENETYRNSYIKEYGLNEENAANHFIEYWGLTSLFHDVGYPFEIAHQQMKVYICALNGVNKNEINGVKEYAPYISFRDTDKLARVNVGGVKNKSGDIITGGVELNIHQLLADSIAKRLGDNYNITSNLLEDIFANRGTFDTPVINNSATYLYMDHAYFSGVILFKKYLESLTNIEDLDPDKCDAITAITLHNSLFKREINTKERPLSLDDNFSLAYLLMLCDELQCFDRACFGQNSRNDIFPFDMSMDFTGDKISCTYYFDEKYEEKALNSSSYDDIKNGKFFNSINKIVEIDEHINFEFKAEFKVRKKPELSLASQTNYLNLYDFALALNARYASNINISKDSTKGEIQKYIREMDDDFNNLSLEFKLSNIAQAKGFAKHLEAINCFYTTDITDFELLEHFTEDDLRRLADLEHTRWVNEKEEMGWTFGTDYLKGDGNKDRNFKRIHKDMVPFEELGAVDIAKDSEPMEFMLSLLTMFDGLRIYRK